MNIQEIYYEDYEIGHVRETFGRTITETDFVVHAGHTGDFFPHHMDAEWCAKQDFGQRIAHGTMVFSIGIGLTASAINPVAFSYGYDRLRFIRPVHIDDTIRTRLTIDRKFPDPKRDGMGQVFEKCEVLNQRDETVLFAEHIYLVQMRGAG
ncbi:MAG: MaoC/PaaZ C-terminal domain-containing protein [Pseudomonadota bacterium]